MTVANEQIQALKAAAEKAIWGDWEDHKPHKGARGYEVKKGITAVAQHCLKDDAAYIAKANPKFILSLLAERDADKALIAEQAKRIAELEAHTLTVKLPESVIDEICLTAAEIHNLGRGVSDERAQEIINSIRRTAGITLVVGE